MGSEGRGITQHLPDTMPTPGILPQGWVYTTLGDIGEINPKLLDECLRRDIDVTFLPMRCLEELTGRLDLSLTRKLSEVKKGYTPFKNGDVLFAKITPCMENGKVAVVHGLTNGIGFGSTEFHVIRLPESFPREFMFYSLVREELRRDARANMTGSAGQLRVSANYLRQMPIALPPLPEQHRIVAKIEELSTRLDAGVHALKTIKTQLKRYRQAVLKHAFEGKLTAEWREAHKDELEPASVLLELIKQERRGTAAGKYRELPPLDTSDLRQLPEGWVWARVGDVSEAIQYGYTASSTSEPVGPKILRITDIQDNSVEWEAVPYCRIVAEKKRKYLLQDGDLVFARTGATVGKSFLIRDSIPEAVFASYLIRIVSSPLINQAFVHSFFQSHDYWVQIHAQKLGIGQPNVNSRTLSRIRLPLCPTLEQHRIVEEIERRFSVADHIEKNVDHGLKQSERLRQSILKRAFEGRLVPQDPNDEPAEILLERIKQERAKQLTEKRVTVSRVKRKRSTEGK